jgi:hypothetical protein
MKIPITRVTLHPTTFNLIGNRGYIVDCHPERKTITILTEQGTSIEESFEYLNFKGPKVWFGHISDEEIQTPNVKIEEV